MGNPQAFHFGVDPPYNLRCRFCLIYRSDVTIDPPVQDPWERAFELGLCRICLSRLRTTLKSAQKALPPLPKKVRPEDNETT